MSSPVVNSLDLSTDSIRPVDPHHSPLSCSSSSLVENGVQSEHREEQEPSSLASTMEYEVVYSFEFGADACADQFRATLGSICGESCVPRSALLFPSLDSVNIFYLCIEQQEATPMSWKGLNSLVSVARVDYRHIESLLDRKNVISIFDLPNFVMCGGSEVLAGLENDIQKLSVTGREQSPPVADAPPRADPTTVRRTLIVTIIKDKLKTSSEEKMRAMANDACFDTNAKDVQAVLDPKTDDHFFLVFLRPSHILDNIAIMRRGLLENMVTMRKVAETTPVVQDRFLELAADSSRCFPVEIKKKVKAEPETKPRVSLATLTKSPRLLNGATTPTAKSEPATPPSEACLRAARGPTSGHVARRLVEGSLGIRSTVPREQVKKENQLVATFAAEKRATRQKQQEVTKQVNEAFQ